MKPYSDGSNVIYTSEETVFCDGYDKESVKISWKLDTVPGLIYNMDYELCIL
jgi:hypothetical protein